MKSMLNPIFIHPSRFTENHIDNWNKYKWKLNTPSLIITNAGNAGIKNLLIMAKRRNFKSIVIKNSVKHLSSGNLNHIATLI